MEFGSLRTREEFDRVFREGRRWRGDYVNVVFVRNEGDPPVDEVMTKIGIAVSRRYGNAVQRNTFRRRLREVVRSSGLPSGSYFFSPRRGWDETTFAGLKSDITRLCVEGLGHGLKKVTNER